MRSFAARLVAWQRIHGRSGLPWQGRDPYRVWVSEIMLQQTQVRTVVPYYERFLARFPNLHGLARAPLDEVMRLWAGLGYYSRARNLHACAQRVEREFGGAFPRGASVIAELPGIGPSTAAAIAAFCFDERVAILDGNVKRVLARHAGFAGDTSKRDVERQMLERAASLLPRAQHMPAYTQGLMDLGATVCTRTAPKCGACPLRRDCVALSEDRVGELPTRRKGNVARRRSACFLLAVTQDAVLLERRPPAGIWGSLLVPPEFADARAMRAALTSIASASKVRALGVRQHAFTHFTLAYTPYLARIETLLPRVAEANQQWLRLDEVGAAPLPAPMRTLLTEVRELLACEAARSST